MFIIAVRRALCLLIALAGLLTLGSMYPGGDVARAGGDRNRDQVMGSAHHSLLQISEAEGFPQVRAIRIGKNKAMLVELPRELRDVMVSAPEIVDAVVQSSNRVHLIAKKVGQSNAFFFDSASEQILTLEITVEQDTASLDSVFARLIPGSNIRSEILNDTVILTGSVRTPVDSSRAADIASRFLVMPEDDKRSASKVINMLAVDGEEQVMLKVVVAEVQRELLKQMGVNLAAQINSGNFAWSVLTSNSLPLTAAAGLGALPIPGIGTAALVDGTSATCTTSGVLCNYNSGPSASTFGNSGITGAGNIGDSRVTNAIRALERDGLVRTLAEPNLTAISGETAKFLAGGEYPIPMRDNTGETTIEYKEFGVGVSFTPIVLSEGRISLKIESEVSELSNTGAVVVNSLSIPALKKRQAKSTVELPSGGSLAIAGLISEDVRQNIDGLPGIKDLPILGTLFRSRDYISRETELVIIVTPYLVKPVSRKDLALPTDGLRPASDLDANFRGHLNRIYGRENEAPPAGDLKGDYGFIVE